MAVRYIPLEVTTVTTIKPQDCSDENKDDQVIHLTIFDRVDFETLIGFLLAFKSPAPTNKAMKEGLSKALSYYPHISGRLSIDRQHLLLNNAGIHLVEMSSSVSLEKILPLDPSTIDNMDDLLSPCHFLEKDLLLYVQLNRFACGGLVVGLAFNHTLADGSSMSHFCHSWTNLVRGLNLEELNHLPCHDRAALSRSRNPPQCLHDHLQIEFKSIPRGPPAQVSPLVLRFTSSCIDKLKAKITNGDPSRRCSTFQCLVTHLWKKLTVARGLSRDQLTQVRVAVDGRRHVKPAIVPSEYFGNLVLWAYPSLRAEEVLSFSYTELSDAIRGAVLKTDDAYFRSFIDYAEVLKANGREDIRIRPPEGDAICPNVEVDSWLGFKFHELDFGSGSPLGFAIPPFNFMEGLLFLVPSCVNEGGVDAFLGVTRHQVDRFLRDVMDLD